MEWWEALILGIVQGLSEFLPISSSGHLILLEKLGVGSTSLIFNISVHLGTLVAVLIALRKSWWPLVRHPFQKKTGNIIIACIPTVILALVFKLFAPDLLGGDMLGFGFVLTAFLLVVSELFCGRKEREMNGKIGILTGLFQGIAVLPGVSRSGSTIAAMRLLGVRKEEAADFSFLLSVPIILGSAIFEAADIARGGAVLDVSISSILIGAAAAFFTGFLAIKWFLKALSKHSLWGFAIYTLLLGVGITAAGFIA